MPDEIEFRPKPQMAFTQSEHALSNGIRVSAWVAFAGASVGACGVQLKNSSQAAHIRSGDMKPSRWQVEEHMEPDKKTLILPVLLITVGCGWLLTTLGIAPGIDWVWTLGIAIVGLLAFVVGGFDKVTFVTGTFFIITSCLSVLRQTERITIDVEVPILVIVAGLLLLVARHPGIPLPKWILEPRKP